MEPYIDQHAEEEKAKEEAYNREQERIKQVEEENLQRKISIMQDMKDKLFIQSKA